MHMQLCCQLSAKAMGSLLGAMYIRFSNLLLCYKKILIQLVINTQFQQVTCRQLQDHSRDISYRRRDNLP